MIQDRHQSDIMNMAVFVSGGGTNLQAIIDAIESERIKGARIVKVIASNEHAYAIARAQKHHIPYAIINRKQYADQNRYDRQMIDELSHDKIDLVVLAGFLSRLGEEFVKAYQYRIINIHPSLIPSFCGKDMYGIRVHQAALKRGVKISGATVHFVNEAYDAGPILLQKAIEVDPQDTPEQLQKRIMIECEQVLLPQAIDLIANQRVKMADGIVYIDPKEKE